MTLGSDRLTTPLTRGRWGIISPRGLGTVALSEGQHGCAACPVVSKHQQSLFTTASSSVHFPDPTLTDGSLQLFTDLRFCPGASVAFPGPQQPMRTFHFWPLYRQGPCDQSVTLSPLYPLLVSGFGVHQLLLVRFIPLGEVQLHHLPVLLSSPSLSLLGKRLAHFFTSWGHGSDLALLVREETPREGALCPPCLMPCIHTQCSPCLMPCIHTRCSPGASAHTGISVVFPADCL